MDNLNHHSAGIAERINRWIIVSLVLIMSVELVFSILDSQWLTSFLIIVVASITLAPVLLKDRLPVKFPPEFQVLAIIFIFASLFLGELQSFYKRFWWWDIALHTTSGLLLGIIGFLLVYVLNENERIALVMKPNFVALFAFFYAVTIGAMWEVFEFGMDHIFGMNMQKPMFGDPSGLTDTMWDLIVDTLGALVISVLGWWYMIRRETSFIDAWIHKFIKSNPELFHPKKKKHSK